VKPSAAPSVAPSSPAAPPPTVPVGPAAYPPELVGGTSYSYSGKGTLTAFALDKRDVGTSACAQIDESTQSVPVGYAVYFFVSIGFPDGNILSSGYIKTSAERHDFGSVQKGSTRTGTANPPGSTAAGSHTYCVTHGASGWTMTDDGKSIFGTTAESAADTSGAEVDFHNSASLNPDNAAPPPVQSFSLVVVGWHNLTVGGKPPTQLTGVVSRF